MCSFNIVRQPSDLASTHVIWSAETAVASDEVQIVRLSLVLNRFMPIGLTPDLDRKLRKDTKLLGELRGLKAFVRFRSW